MKSLKRIYETVVGPLCSGKPAGAGSPQPEMSPAEPQGNHGFSAEDIEQLKGMVERSRRPQPGRYFSIIPDYGLKPPLGPVSQYLDTPVESTSFERITREWNLEECIARDNMPLPALEDREYYHPGREYDYWLSGLRDYFSVSQELERIGAPLRSGQSLFEWGAASGRALRHFVAQDDNHYRLFASDMNSNHVEWLLRHFPPGVLAFEASAFPFLPLEDNCLDVVMAFSVFTHIDEYEMAWIMEIRRILKPGGVAYLTFQSEHTWGSLDENHFLYHHLKNNESKLGGRRIVPELFSQPMPEPKMVFRFLDNNVYNTVVFTSFDHVRSRWGRCFSGLEILPGAHEFQDVALCRK